MRGAFFNRNERRGLASLLVFVFLLRALIPAGFMPSAGGGFPLELCPAVFPSALLAKAGAQASHADHEGHPHPGPHEHAGTDQGRAEKSGFEQCPFGSASPALAAADAGSSLLGITPDAAPAFTASSAHPARLVRSQRARAPPFFS
jgi:hypothetical protein